MNGNSILDGLVTPRIDTAEGVAWHLDALTGLAPQLRRMWETVGPVLPRVNPKGFAGMAKVICGQQLSVASAAAIWGRFEQLPGALEPGTYLELSEEVVRGSGFSRGKFVALRVVAEAITAGELDFAHVDALPAEDAIARLVALKGIGPWTAEVYLLFCAGHPDIFPAGDLALLKAAHHGLGLDARPTIKDMIRLARDWSPHRSAAALLFWRYFAALKQRDSSLL
ncbi:DNA-3-methyladenine glycosylase family protein [Devosia ureilytica]|uniref:DNA-3-methyladenine glycosylase II n=1 Tax=Devosia ureilytica TaxID=2952754 RepID=A0A9Q4FSL8_9HYPH|nr:DNA-3-methyladenine glycosylase 2 family protein [Devosia ureilytica]MCP8887005.1 DNA-3-methyladenine glycosylase 2 family protein [Devosia ureilytica]